MEAFLSLPCSSRFEVNIEETKDPSVVALCSSEQINIFAPAEGIYGGFTHETTKAHTVVIWHEKQQLFSIFTPLIRLDPLMRVTLYSDGTTLKEILSKESFTRSGKHCLLGQPLGSMKGSTLYQLLKYSKTEGFEDMPFTDAWLKDETGKLKYAKQ